MNFVVKVFLIWLFCASIQAQSITKVFWKSLDDSTIYIRFDKSVIRLAGASDTLLITPTGMLFGSGTNAIIYELDTLGLGKDSGIAHAVFMIIDSTGTHLWRPDTNASGDPVIVVSNDAGVNWDTLHPGDVSGQSNADSIKGMPVQDTAGNLQDDYIPVYDAVSGNLNWEAQGAGTGTADSLIVNSGGGVEDTLLNDQIKLKEGTNIDFVKSDSGTYIVITVNSVDTVSYADSTSRAWIDAFADSINVRYADSTLKARQDSAGNDIVTTYLPKVDVDDSIANHLQWDTLTSKDSIKYTGNTDILFQIERHKVKPVVKITPSSANNSYTYEDTINSDVTPSQWTSPVSATTIEMVCDSMVKYVNDDADVGGSVTAYDSTTFYIIQSDSAGILFTIEPDTAQDTITTQENTDTTVISTPGTNTLSIGQGRVWFDSATFAKILIDDSLGIGTATPENRIHIKDSGSQKILIEGLVADDSSMVIFKTPQKTYVVGVAGVGDKFGIGPSGLSPSLIVGGVGADTVDISVPVEMSSSVEATGSGYFKGKLQTSEIVSSHAGDSFYVNDTTVFLKLIKMKGNRIVGLGYPVNDSDVIHVLFLDSVLDTADVLNADTADYAFVTDSIADESVDSTKIKDSSVALIDIHMPTGASEGQIIKKVSGIWQIANDATGAGGANLLVYEDSVLELSTVDTINFRRAFTITNSGDGWVDVILDTAWLNTNWKIATATLADSAGSSADQNVWDKAGSMVSNNVESQITITYQDSTLDFTVDNPVDSADGAERATKDGGGNVISTTYLNKDGSVIITGDFDWGDKDITNIDSINARILEVDSIVALTVIIVATERIDHDTSIVSEGELEDSLDNYSLTSAIVGGYVAKIDSGTWDEVSDKLVINQAIIGNASDSGVADSSVSTRGYVQKMIEDSLNEYSLTSSISSTYETIANVGLIGDDTTNFKISHDSSQVLTANYVAKVDSGTWDEIGAKVVINQGIIGNVSDSGVVDSNISTRGYVEKIVEDSLDEYSLTSGVRVIVHDTADILRAEMDDSVHSHLHDTADIVRGEIKDTGDVYYEPIFADSGTWNMVPKAIAKFGLVIGNASDSGVSDSNAATRGYVEKIVEDSLNEYSLTSAIEDLIADSLDEYSLTTAIQALIGDSLDEYSLTSAIVAGYLAKADSGSWDEIVAKLVLNQVIIGNVSDTGITDSGAATLGYVQKMIEDSLNEYSLTSSVRVIVHDTADILRAEMDDSVHSHLHDTVDVIRGEIKDTGDVYYEPIFVDSGSWQEITKKTVVNTAVVIGNVSDTSGNDSLAATHGWSQAEIEDSLNEYSLTSAIEVLIEDSLNEYSLTSAITSLYFDTSETVDTVQGMLVDYVTDANLTDTLNSYLDTAIIHDSLDILRAEMDDSVTTTNVNAAGAVMESDFNATTFLYALTDNTPLPKTPAEVRAILNVEDGATADQTDAEIEALIGPFIDTTTLDTIQNAHKAVAADSAGKALGDASGNTITTTYETIANVGLIGDDTTTWKTVATAFDTNYTQLIVGNILLSNDSISVVDVITVDTVVVNADVIKDFTGTNLTVTAGVLNAIGGGLDTTEVLDILRDSISGDGTVGAGGVLDITHADSADIASDAYTAHKDKDGDSIDVSTYLTSESGTADSMQVDTSGAGGYAKIYGTSGYAFTFRESSGIDFTADNDTVYMAATLGDSVSLSSEVIGLLPVSKGGTGTLSLIDGSVLFGNGTNTIGNSGVLTEGELLIGDGTTDPSIVAMSGDGTMGSDGALVIIDDSHNHIYSNIDETTSLNWASRVSNETGTGVWVFGTEPTISQPTLTLKQGIGSTAEGAIEWHVTNNTILVGSGGADPYTLIFHSGSHVDTGWVEAEIEDSLNEYSLTSAIASLYPDTAEVVDTIQGTVPAIIGESLGVYFDTAEVVDTAQALDALYDNFSEIGGTVGDAQIADSAVDGGAGGEIADNSVTMQDDMATFTEAQLETQLSNVTDVFTDNDGALNDDDVTAADLGNASANIAADGTIEWEDATDLDANGALNADVVAAAEMADADHGDVSWSGGVASVEGGAADDADSLGGVPASMYLTGQYDLTLHGQFNQWNVLNRLDTSFVTASYPNTYLRLPQFYSGWDVDDSAKCVDCDSSFAFHPAFVYIPEGLFSDAHHRNSRWLGYGPICVSARDENPHIAVRDENEYWHEYFVGPESTWCVTAAGDSIPIGYYDSTLHNPIYDVNDTFYFSGDAWSGTADTFVFLSNDHLSDQDLTVDYDSRMWLPFRGTWEIAGTDSHCVIIGYTDDGLNWSAGEVILSNKLCQARGDSTPHNSAGIWSFMSPSILPDTQQTFEMWTVQYTTEGSAADIYVAKWEAPKADSGWRFVDTCRWTPSSGSKHPWHISMFRRGYDEVWCLFSESDSLKTGDSSVLMLAVSYDDGITFTTMGDTVLGLGDSSWNDRLGPYRCDCAKVNTEGDDYFELYCSSKGTGHGEALWVSKLFFNVTVSKSELGDSVTALRSSLNDTTVAIRANIRDTIDIITDLDSGNVAAGALSLSADMHMFTKANLEAKTADVADYAEADGDTWTGVHDFGGATSLEMPNGPNPTTDAEGEWAWDSDDDMFETYSGNEGESVVLSIYSSFQATLFNPDLLTDSLPLFDVGALEWPGGIEIDSIQVTTSEDGVYALGFIAYSNADPPVLGQWIDTLNVGANDQKANSVLFTDAAIEVGKTIYVSIPATDIAWVKFSIWFHGKDHN